MEVDQVDVFWRTTLTFCVQILFCIVIGLYSNISAVTQKQTEVHVVLFFTVLLLHIVCKPNSVDGLAMMKYALLHSEEFTNPIVAFMLGWMCLTSMIIAEIVNILSSCSKTAIGEAIASFIGFKLVIDLPNLYMASNEEFPLKAAVGKLDFKRGRKSKDEVAFPGGWFFGSVYTLYYVFFKSVFFYFFPLAAVMMPFLLSLKENVKV